MRGWGVDRAEGRRPHWGSEGVEMPLVESSFVGARDRRLIVSPRQHLSYWLLAAKYCQKPRTC